MIAFVRGTVAQRYENRVILDVNGMGYQIFLSAREAQAMPQTGAQVQLHTYLQVKEDAMQLYGFLSQDDLEVFRLLLGVSGIGPKAALGILSVLTADDLRFAVLSDDVKTIARAPGIGPKTAKKMILDLKDKLSLEEAFERKLDHSQESPEAGGVTAARAEAVQALTALGYSGSDALRAVKKVPEDGEMDVEEILKAALKQMSFL